MASRNPRVIAGEASMLVLRGHEHRVTCVAYAPDGRTLASGSFDGTVRLWDLSSGRERAVLIDADRTPRRWDIRTGRDLAPPRDEGTLVEAVAFSPDGRILASASTDGKVRLWDVEEGTLRDTWDCTASCLAFSPNGALLITGGGQVVVWDIVGSRQSSRLSPDPGTPGWSLATVWSLACSPDGLVVAVGTGGSLLLFRSRQKKPTRYGWSWRVDPLHFEPPAHGITFIRSVAFSPDGRTLSHTERRDIVLRDLEGAELGRLSGHGDLAWSVAFSPEGRTLTSAGLDGTVRLWDVANRRGRVALDLGVGQVGVVAFAPDGMTIAAAGIKEVVICDVDEGDW